MGIRKKISNILGFSKNKQSANSPEAKKSRQSSKTTLNSNTDAKHIPSPDPGDYKKKQQIFSCIVTVNDQDAAIEISNALNSKLNIWSEVGLNDGDICVFVKPECNITRAKKIVLDVLKKELHRDNTIKWKLHDHVKANRRKHARLNLVNCDKQSILSLVDETAVQSEKQRIEFHQSVFIVSDVVTGNYFGELIDISQGGFKIISDTPLEKSKTYYLEFDFRKIKNISQKVLFNAECVYINDTLQENHFICGFKYTKIDSNERNIIKLFIDLFSKLD